MATYGRSFHAGNGRYLSACMGFIKKKSKKSVPGPISGSGNFSCNFK
jgi:hypothetical protein